MSYHGTQEPARKYRRVGEGNLTGIAYAEGAVRILSDNALDLPQKNVVLTRAGYGVEPCNTTPSSHALPV